MLKKFASWITIFALLVIIFQGCAKPPPPPPIDPGEVDVAWGEAQAAKAKLESLEKERDMLKAELEEKENELERAKKCADGN